MTIDYNKPIRVVGAPEREVKVQHILSDGSAIVEIGPVPAGWLMFGPNGEWRMASTGDSRGSALSLEQTPPEKKKLYVRVSIFPGLDQISLHRKPIEGAGVASVELTVVEGIITKAELVKSNEYPLRQLVLGTRDDTIHAL